MKLLSALPEMGPVELSVPYFDIPLAVTKSAGLKIELDDTRIYIAVSPGASVPQKQWPVDNFLSLVKALSERTSKGCPGRRACR